MGDHIINTSESLVKMKMIVKKNDDQQRTVIIEEKVDTCKQTLIFEAKHFI